MDSEMCNRPRLPIDYVIDYLFFEGNRNRNRLFSAKTNRNRNRNRKEKALSRFKNIEYIYKLFLSRLI